MQFNFLETLLRILESGEKIDTPTKATVLRLIGNLCCFKESAIYVGSNSSINFFEIFLNELRSYGQNRPFNYK